MINIEYILKDFETAKSILEDEQVFESYGKKDLSIELGQIKLLLARLEDPDFEEKLAKIICGDNTNFPCNCSPTIISQICH